jgi:hypothetical protein
MSGNPHRLTWWQLNSIPRCPCGHRLHHRLPLLHTGTLHTEHGCRPA